MKYGSRNIDQYLRSYPQLQKWINQCPVCGARGLKAEMPQSVGEMHGEIAAKTLRRMLPIMEVDKDGFCLVCSRLYNKI